MKFNLFPLACVLFLGVAFIQKESKPEKPNIIIIYADDLGYGDVSAYGKGTLQTPNIDKLAQNGIRFTFFYPLTLVSISRITSAPS